MTIRHRPLERSKSLLLAFELLLRLRHQEPGLDDAVRVEGYAVYAALHQELGELGEVGGRLTAAAYLLPLLLQRLDRAGDHGLDRRIALVVEVRDELRLPDESQ